MSDCKSILRPDEPASHNNTALNFQTLTFTAKIIGLHSEGSAVQLCLGVGTCGDMIYDSAHCMIVSHPLHRIKHHQPVTVVLILEGFEFIFQLHICLTAAL